MSYFRESQNMSIILMASFLQINGFMYTFIHHSLIEWLLCARQNIKAWDKEIQETLNNNNKKNSMKLPRKFAPKACIIKVVHFLRLLDRLYGKSEAESESHQGDVLTAHPECRPLTMEHGLGWDGVGYILQAPKKCPICWKTSLFLARTACLQRLGWGSLVTENMACPCDRRKRDPPLKGFTLAN